MKRYYQYIIVTVILIAAVISCMELKKFLHPQSAPIDSYVDVSLEIEYNLEGFDRTAKVVVAMLAPTNWNSDDIVVTYSSENMRGGPYVNMPMHRIPPNEIDSQSGLDWVSSLTKGLGKFGNYDPVQWVAFMGEEDHNWKIGDNFTATVNIKFKTGTENIRVNLVYFVSNSVEGVHNDSQYYILQDFLFETTGGSNPLVDYTVPKMCSVSPVKFTYKDIIRLNFNATVQVDDEDSPLKGADEVFFMAKAIYDNETKSVEVYETSAKTLMHKEDKDKWFVYFYPHEYFSIPTDVKIDNISYYITDRDKSIEVRLPNGNDFVITEDCD